MISLALVFLCSVSVLAGTDSTDPRQWGHFDQRELLHQMEHGTPRPVERVDSTHSWNALTYDIDFRIFPELTYLEARVEMTLVTLDTLSVVDYHLHAFTVDSVLLDGQAVEFSRSGDDLLVDVGYNCPPGEQLTLQTFYQGEPALTPGMGSLGMHFGSTIFTVSDPWGTRNWVACYDEPFDKALVSLRAVVPQPWVVASNGTLVSTEELGDSLVAFQYEHAYPISTYLLTLTASQYTTWHDEVEGVPLNYWVYPYHLTASQEDFSTVPQMFTFFQDTFGDYPFECYGMSEAPIYGGSGAMEHQTCTTLGHNLITGQHTYEMIVAHELAHMWWGDALTHVTFAEMWLHEGFATYCEALYYQFLQGGDTESLFDYMEQARDYYLSWQAGHPSQPLPIYDPPLEYLFSALTYEKAACVLQTLRVYIGDENFLQGLRDWYTTFQYGNICTYDFRTVMETVSGEELGPFMEEWIYSPGYPLFEHLTTSYQLPDDSTLVSLSVAQSSMFGNLFTPRVPVVITTTSDSFDFLLQISGASDHFLFRLPGDFIGLEFNPHHQVLCTDQEIPGVGGPLLVIADWELDDSAGGNGNGNLSAGEQGWLRLLVENHGAWAEDISLSLSTADPLLTVEVDSAWVGTLDLHGETWTGWTLLLADSPGDELRYLDLAVHFSGTGFEQDTTFIFRVGDPPLVVVCDDTSNTLLSYYEQSLTELEQFWDVIDQSAGETAAGVLQNYTAAIWYTGNARVDALTATEQELLTDWISGGGQLLLTGQYLIEDLWGSAFLVEQLYCTAQDSAVDIRILDGVDGNLVSDDMTILLQGAGGANNQVAPASLLPLAGSTPVFNYQGSGEVGAVWTTDQVLFCAFGCEAISGAGPTASLAELLGRVLNAWSPESVTVAPDLQPRQLELYSNYPNPFNNRTQISFRLLRDLPVRLDIFNVLGVRVTTLINEQLPAGYHQAVFDASDHPSGVYFCHLRGGASHGVVGKMVLVK
ncbi:MAG: T9SS type A sorting domain-containing protein [Candidatus Delongbacteria bacterium]|nr:T9SS type A sorting domain-containing protein [Candidatus Delongbacteria bacterium]